MDDADLVLLDLAMEHGMAGPGMLAWAEGAGYADLAASCTPMPLAPHVTLCRSDPSNDLASISGEGPGGLPQAHSYSGGRNHRSRSGYYSHSWCDGGRRYYTPRDLYTIDPQPEGWPSGTHGNTRWHRRLQPDGTVTYEMEMEYPQRFRENPFVTNHEMRALYEGRPNWLRALLPEEGE